MVPQWGPFDDVSIIKISEESMEENYYSNNKPNKIIVAKFYCCIFFIFLFKMQRFIIINFKNLIIKLFFLIIVFRAVIAVHYKQP